MCLRLTAALMLSFGFLATSPMASAGVQSFIAAHAYILGARNSKDDPRQVDASVRGDEVAQKERLNRLEEQLLAIQRQQEGQSSGHAPAFPPIDVSAEDLQWLHALAAKSNADAQVNLGWMYDKGYGVPQDSTKARRWYEKAAAQGHPGAQFNLGALYHKGQGVPQMTRWHDSGGRELLPKAMRRRSTVLEHCTPSGMVCRKITRKPDNGGSKLPARGTRWRRPT